MRVTFPVVLALAGMLGTVVGLAQTKSPEAPASIVKPSGPRIEFDSVVYDFGTTNAGTLVKHDFVFTNSGTTTLEISDVRPGCGCTTAGVWDKKVEPGKTGIIPLQFNSANYSGSVLKSASVLSNDPNQSNAVLQIKGTVWKAIDVIPSTALFNVSTDTATNETRVVRIVNRIEEPLNIFGLDFTNQTFRAQLRTVRPGKEFEVEITAIAPFTATNPIAVPIHLKTSSAAMPGIDVTAYLAVHEPVTIIPTELSVPPGPLKTSMGLSIGIRSDWTNSLVLSDAKINFPGASVRVMEGTSGRAFSLLVALPEGFQVKPNQKVEVTVKSNHPRLSIIKVPIVEAAPALVPVAAAQPVRLIPPPKEK